jgi:hypothetical protein
LTPLKHQIFPLRWSLSKNSLDLFKLSYSTLFFKSESLKLILDDLLSSPAFSDLLSYFLAHPRTLTLLSLHSYPDKLKLSAYVALTHPSLIFTNPSTQWTAPGVFWALSRQTIASNVTVTEEEIGEYVEGVGSNEAMYMVS